MQSPFCGTPNATPDSRIYGATHLSEWESQFHIINKKLLVRRSLAKQKCLRKSFELHKFNVWFSQCGGKSVPYFQSRHLNSAFHPSGFGKLVPASAGKEKAGMVHSVSGWMRGVQVKLWDPLRTRAIPECLRGVFTTRRYTNIPLPLPLQQCIVAHGRGLLMTWVDLCLITLSGS